MKDESGTALRALPRPPHLTLASATADTLRRAIESGFFLPETQLPTEMELIDRLGVSRTTVRDALRTLENEGLIERRRGLGTFVAAKPILKDFGTNFGISDMIMQTGRTPGALSCAIRHESAPDDVADELGLPRDAAVLVIERTRTADGCAVGWSQDYLDDSLLNTELLKRFQPESDSLYHFLASECHIYIAYGSAEFRSVAACGELAGRMEIAAGTPLLLVRQTDYDQSNRPVIYSIEYYSPGPLVFLIKRKGPYWRNTSKS